MDLEALRGVIGGSPLTDLDACRCELEGVRLGRGLLDAREVQVLEDNRAYLQAVKDYVASDAYVEQQARRQLGYVRPGEIPFVVTGPELPKDANRTGEWWQRLFPR